MKSPFILRQEETCPNRAAHVTGEPRGYVEWFEWARQMARTHRQARCPGCGLYVIWDAKREAVERG